MDKQVEEYLEKQKSPQKEILQKVRKIFLKTLPSCEEKSAWGVIVFAGGKFYIAAMKYGMLCDTSDNDIVFVGWRLGKAVGLHDLDSLYYGV